MWWISLTSFAFQPQMDSELTLPVFNPTGLSVGDFNGDGYDDLICGDLGLDSSALVGGPGGLTAVVAYRVRDGVGVVVDVDGDGYDDVVSDDGATVVLQRGGSFGLGFAYAWSHAMNGYLARVVGGDFDDDGFDDIAFSNDAPGGGAPRTEIYHGSALGLPASPNATIGGESFRGVSDMDADGYDDLLLGAVGGTWIRLFRGGPTGVSANVSWLRRLDPGVGAFDGNFTGGGDLDGDGYDDLVVRSGSWFVGNWGFYPTIVWGHPQSVLSKTELWSLFPEPWVTLAVPDRDLDGDDELLIGDWYTGGSRGLVELHDGGTGALLQSVRGLDGNDAIGMQLVTGDFNGDGSADWATYGTLPAVVGIDYGP